MILIILYKPSCEWVDKLEQVSTLNRLIWQLWINPKITVVWLTIALIIVFPDFPTVLHSHILYYEVPLIFSKLILKLNGALLVDSTNIGQQEKENCYVHLEVKSENVLLH